MLIDSSYKESYSAADSGNKEVEDAGLQSWLLEESEGPIPLRAP
jgi:hypothetical protein